MRLLFPLALLATCAFADIIPREVAECRGKAAGAACTTPEGHAGTCVETSVSQADYSNGIPPTYRQVKMLGCVAIAKGSAKAVTPWLGAGLAFLALLAALGRKAFPLAAKRGERADQLTPTSNDAAPRPNPLPAGAGRGSTFS